MSKRRETRNELSRENLIKFYNEHLTKYLIMYKYKTDIEQINDLSEKLITFSDNNSKTEIMVELVNLLKNNINGFYFVELILNAKNINDIIWNEESSSEARKQLQIEIMEYRHLERGVEGLGKCKHCNSTELIFIRKQDRAADEETNVKVKCQACLRGT